MKPNVVALIFGFALVMGCTQDQGSDESKYIEPFDMSGDVTPSSAMSAADNGDYLASVWLWHHYESQGDSAEAVRHRDDALEAGGDRMWIVRSSLERENNNPESVASMLEYLEYGKRAGSESAARELEETLRVLRREAESGNSEAQSVLTLYENENLELIR